MRKQRLEYLGELYLMLKQELESRDLSEVSTEKLIEALSKLENKLVAEFNNIQHSVSETVEQDRSELTDVDKTQIITQYKIN